MIVKEKDFIKLFVLELILVEKDSVFYLGDYETAYLPNNYLTILDEMTKDEVKRTKYQDLIPIEGKEEWKFKVTKGLNDFLKSTGVTHSYEEDNVRINLNRDAITKILCDKKYNYSTKARVAELVEDFVITKAKNKPKQKTLK